MKVNIGIVDDHQLFLKSLKMLVESFPNFDVNVEALNGELLISQLAAANPVPDILLVDVNMPVMDGGETAAWVSKQYPEIKLVALSMNDEDTAVIKMIKNGCCAYLLKGIHPDELERALIDIAEKGYYNGDLSNVNFRRLIKHSHDDKIVFSEREITFLQLASTDMTYKQIAATMFLSERTIDGYREALFQKLNVQSRVGMVLEALRRHLISLN